MSLFYKVVMWKSGFGEMLEPGEIFLSMMVLTLAWPPKQVLGTLSGPGMLEGARTIEGTHRY